VKGKIIGFLVTCLCLAFISCGGSRKQALEKITILLDWTPNTNHTGLYCAKNLGYFEEEGLEVDILLAQEGGTSALVSSGKAPFGVSYQEEVTYARSEKLPVVAIAAMVQHNTSGFAAPSDRGVKTPADFEGKRYGGWGSPVETALLKTLVSKHGGDFSKVEMLSSGAASFVAAVEKNMFDFAWIYYGWDGILAELREIPLTFFLLQDEDPRLDFYTPVIITSEKTISERPEFVKSFLKAVSRGYDYAIQNPDKAAEILLKEVPELDKELIFASQRYLSPRYQDDAPYWGYMKEAVWNNYMEWLIENDLLSEAIDIKQAYTIEFLAHD